jgi:hypothetical protein
MAKHTKQVYEEDNEGNATQTDTYIFEGASGASIATILADSDIPDLNDVASGTGGAVARSRRVERDGPTNRVATVTVTNSTRPATGGTNPDEDRDPTTDPPQLSMQPASASMTRYYDFSTPQKAYRNSAGQMLDPVPETDDPRVVFIFEKKVNDIAAAANQNLTHEGTTNQSGFTLSSDLFSVAIGAKKALFLGHACSPAGYYTDSLGEKHAYWHQRSEFLVRKQDWNPWKVADYGTAKLIDDPDNPGQKTAAQIVVNGVPLSDPVPLDGAGQPKDLADPNAKPAELSFKPYEETDFGGLV